MYKLTDATPGSSTEWNVAVVVPVGCVLRQEVVRVEDVGVLVVLRVAVDLQGTDDDGSTSWQHVVVGGWNIKHSLMYTLTQYTLIIEFNFSNSVYLKVKCS